MRNIACFLFALVLVLQSGQIRGDETEPVVVELFTSQGCPACPPAEEYLRELAARSGVVALEYHIDYFDYAGWKDPFGAAAFTRRWHDYAQRLDARYDYTPFMVVGGSQHVVGSQRAKVERQIAGERKRQTPHPRLRLNTTEEAAIVSVSGDGPVGIFDVILVTYDRRHETVVTAGENRGRTLVNMNVVRDFRRVAQWVGQPVRVSVPRNAISGDGGCAVLLQRTGGGPILAAAQISF